MYCSNCGNIVGENAEFCHMCGTKINHGEIEELHKDIVSNKMIKESSGVTEDLTQIRKLEKLSDIDVYDFKKFIDNHVQKNTECKTAEELLKSQVPLRFVWICFAVPAVLIFIIYLINKSVSMMEAIFLMICVSLLFGYLSAYIVGIMKKEKLSLKYKGKFEGNIDIDDLIEFLNNYLGYLYPYFHEWGHIKCEALSVRGALEQAVEDSIRIQLKEINLCTEFGEKKRRLSTITIRPDAESRNLGKIEYYPSAENKIEGASFLSHDMGFAKYKCLYKTAPILQAAMEYYLHYYKSNSEQQTQNESVVILENSKDSTDAIVSMSQQQLNAHKKASKKKNLFIIIASVILALIIAFVIYNWEGEVDYKSTVREQQPFTVQDISSTYGEVFDKYIIEDEWKIRESDDTVYVYISGEAKGTDNELVITIKVNPDPDNTDTVLISPESITINDQISLTQNDAVEFLYAMFWMYAEGYNNISELFSDIGDSVSDYNSDSAITDSNEGNKILIEDTQYYNNEYGNMEVTLEYVEFDNKTADMWLGYEYADEGYIFMTAMFCVKNVGTENSSFLTSWNTLVYDEMYEYNYHSVEGEISIAPLAPPETVKIVFMIPEIVMQSEAPLLLNINDISGNAVLSYVIRNNDSDNEMEAYNDITVIEAEEILIKWFETYLLDYDVKYELLDEHGNWGNGKESFKYTLWLNGEEFWLYIDKEDGSIFIENEMEVMPIEYWYDACHGDGVEEVYKTSVNIDYDLVGRWRSLDGGMLEFDEFGNILNMDFKCWSIFDDPDYIAWEASNGRVTCDSAFCYDKTFEIATTGENGAYEQLRFDGYGDWYLRDEEVKGEGLIGRWINEGWEVFTCQFNEGGSGLWNDKYEIAWYEYETEKEGVLINRVEYTIFDSAYFDYYVNGDVLTVYLSDGSRVYTKVSN